MPFEGFRATHRHTSPLSSVKHSRSALAPTSVQCVSGHHNLFQLIILQRSSSSTRPLMNWNEFQSGEVSASNGPTVSMLKTSQPKIFLNGFSQFKPRNYPPVPPESGASESCTELAEKIDVWDKSNQMKMRHLESQSSNVKNLYESLQQMREAERAEMEKRGLVDNLDSRRNLADAIKFVGTCREMCPVFERVRRSLENNVNYLEKDPNGRVTPDRAVKAFNRPAAGAPPALPSDVRPPSVLVQTLNYLIENILPQLPQSHSFLWDRTRSIRQDFTFQNYVGKETVYCTELIARIHAASLHIMAGSQDYSRQQELEQLNKSLQTLGELYDRYPQRSLEDFPNEPEMRAFQMFTRMENADIGYTIESLPPHVVQHPLVKLAMEVRSYIYTHPSGGALFVKFFEKVRSPSTPVLLQCLAEIHFNKIRLRAIQSIRKAQHKKRGKYFLNRLVRILFFDTLEDAMEFCKYHQINLVDSDGKKSLDLGNWDEAKALDLAPMPQQKSQFITDRLDAVQAVINGSSSSSSKTPSLPSMSTAPIDPAAGFGFQNTNGASKSAEQFSFGTSLRAQPSGPSFKKVESPLFGNDFKGIPSKSGLSGDLSQPKVSNAKLDSTQSEKSPNLPNKVEKPQFTESDYSNLISNLIRETVHEKVTSAARSSVEHRQKALQDLRDLRVGRRNAFVDAVSKDILASVIHDAVSTTCKEIALAESEKRTLILRRIFNLMKKAYPILLSSRESRHPLTKHSHEFLDYMHERQLASTLDKRKRRVSATNGYSDSSVISLADLSAKLFIPDRRDKSAVEAALKTAAKHGARTLDIDFSGCPPEVKTYVEKLLGLSDRSVRHAVSISTGGAKHADLNISFDHNSQSSDDKLVLPDHFDGPNEVLDELVRYFQSYTAPNLSMADDLEISANVSIFGSDVSVPRKRVITPQPTRKRFAYDLSSDSSSANNALFGSARYAPKARGVSKGVAELQELIARSKKYL